MSSHWKLTVLVWTEVYLKLKKKILSPAPSWTIRCHWDADKQIAGPVHCREDRAQKRGDEHIACIDMLMHNERKIQRPGRSSQIWQVWEDNYCSITAWYGMRHWARADPISTSSMKVTARILLVAFIYLSQTWAKKGHVTPPESDWADGRNACAEEKGKAWWAHAICSLQAILWWHNCDLKTQMEKLRSWRRTLKVHRWCCHA